MKYTKYTVSVGMIRGRKVYMSQRINTPNFTNKWQFAGGKLDEGENPVLGGVREVFEETGLIITSDRLKCVMNILEDPTTDICYGFIVELKDNEVPKTLEPHKMTDWILITFEEALKLDLMPGLRTILEQLKNTI
jgi:8-oxo-dGTP pyrophosphatase MutT (NUDIX family)